MAIIYKDEDANLSILKDKTIAVIGYGSQGKHQALNMRDSGLNVIIGLRKEGKSWNMAEEDGFKVYEISEASKISDFIAILIPDVEQPRIYEKEIAPYLTKGKILGFAHGFNIHFGLIRPPNYVDVIMVAPKSPGVRVREEFLKGYGVPALVAVYQDATGYAWEEALAWAKAIGSTKPGVIKTTFKEETETDLFGEQCVLVGGLMELIKKGFEVLIENGYQPELAYFEVLNETKLIMDLIHQGGIEHMLKGVSDTAKYGGLVYGPKVIDDHVKRNMYKILENVTSGNFAKEWMGDPEKSRKKLNELMSEIQKHPIEKTGKEVRRLMGIEK
ncbi:MAG: ketol-acid reductoisomerase [Candidatus Methanomethyliaceae archaeon]|nr:ketol-acid reductoisomerase [Candidatus Methanomethyliaceae archaeon]MDW7970546.1 ketol-acid reductoisomerase [Nitrososphaerota archaeon]